MTVENVVIYSDNDLVRVERRAKPASIVRAREKVAVVIDYGGRSFGQVELDQTLANPDFAAALLRILPIIEHSAPVADPAALVGIYQDAQGRRVTASGLVRGVLGNRREMVASISPSAIANGGPNHARIELAGVLTPLNASANLTVHVDGREMPSGCGWELANDGLAVNVWIPDATDIDARLRYMQNVKFLIRWLE